MRLNTPSLTLTCYDSIQILIFKSNPALKRENICYSCYSIFSFIWMFCRSLFVFFLMAIVLSVLLRLTDSDYTFGIFKLFLEKNFLTEIRHRCTKLCIKFYDLFLLFEIYLNHKKTLSFSIIITYLNYNAEK